jgi:microsomal dipeptidase-like Zn-dependent dipeptidase
MVSEPKRKIILATVAAILAGAAVFFFRVLPHEVDRIQNSLGAGVTELQPAAVPDWHRDLRIVDLHADTLLWDRDLLKRGTRGHVDLPRLLEGPIALQVFSVVTKSPRGLNMQGNRGDTDNITILALAQRWPFATWGSLSERALYQARRLHEAVDASEGRMRLVRTRSDLQSLLRDRETKKDLVGAMLAIEGAHALEGDLGKMDALEAAGFRVIAPTHLFDSELAGSQQGEFKGGLTDLGREWVRQMNQRKLIIDAAHVSTVAIEEILELSEAPIVVSHTGFKVICDTNRNLSDELVKKIAERGGLLGVGLWDDVICSKSLSGVAEALEHAVKIAGIEHVALGSDWDGFVSTPIDAARIGWLTAKLVERGWSQRDIQLVMGENALAFFAANLPE